MQADEIRRAFCDYFVSSGHKLFASASLLPEDDPTLLFTNAGMVPFKDIFCGNRPIDDAARCAVSVQACLRAGGKHNDLENGWLYVSPSHVFRDAGQFFIWCLFQRTSDCFGMGFFTPAFSP